MYTFKTSHKHLKQARQMRSRRGTYFVTGLLALTVFWTLYTVRRVILKNKPLPSQMRSRLQSQEISEHLATMDFHPGKIWIDTDGDLVQAHGGGVMYHDGMYYLYGENKAGATYTAYSLGYSPPRVDVIGVSVYSSKDFVRWTYQGLALKGGTHPDIDPSMVLERPKVLHNPRTGKFVMWMHIDSGDYELARLGVAVSDNPHGPFRYQGSFRPHGQQSRDFTVFADCNRCAVNTITSKPQP